jgi:hypothetical protein
VAVRSGGDLFVGPLLVVECIAPALYADGMNDLLTLAEFAGGADLLTLRQVTELLGWHEDSVRRKVASGELPGVNISPDDSRKPTWRVSRRALDEWIVRKARGRV